MLARILEKCDDSTRYTRNAQRHTHLSQKAHHVKRTLSIEPRRRLVAKETVWGRERLEPYSEAALLASGKAPAKDVADDDVALLGETEAREESVDFFVVNLLS